jgi:hypothetical protein
MARMPKFPPTWSPRLDRVRPLLLEIEGIEDVCVGMSEEGEPIALIKVKAGATPPMWRIDDLLARVPVVFDRPEQSPFKRWLLDRACRRQQRPQVISLYLLHHQKAKS